MLVWLATFLEKIRRSLIRFTRWGIGRWQLLLVVMLAFALNRYAVTSIQVEQRSLQARVIYLQSESKQMRAKIQQMQQQIGDFDDPKWKEMVIMRQLLLFPSNTDVYWHLSDQSSVETEL